MLKSTAFGALMAEMLGTVEKCAIEANRDANSIAVQDIHAMKDSLLNIRKLVNRAISKDFNEFHDSWSEDLEKYADVIRALNESNGVPVE